MEVFDFNAPAEVFARTAGGGKRRPLSYWRFLTGAEAIKHVMEVLAAERLEGTIVETDKARLGSDEIRALYNSPEYPLPRRNVS